MISGKIFSLLNGDLSEFKGMFFINNYENAKLANTFCIVIQDKLLLYRIVSKENKGIIEESVKLETVVSIKKPKTFIKKNLNLVKQETNYEQC